MAENGIQYSTGNTLNFTTNNTTWATLTSGGTFQVSSISATTYSNVPSSGGGTFTGGTVSGATRFISGLTANTFSATTATIRKITGGSGNTNSGVYSFIGGGQSNSSISNCSVIAGGRCNNTNSGYYGEGINFIGGGMCNNVNSDLSTVSGGYKNTNDNGRYSFIGGGSSNTISGIYGYLQGTVIVGGASNCITYGSISSSIVGGSGNSIQSDTAGTISTYGFIGGGQGNIICGNIYGNGNISNVIAGGSTNSVINNCHSSILGGSKNIITGNTFNIGHSTISGGYCNSIRCCNSFIGGGRINTITGNFSSILGGSGNTVSGLYSSAIGCGLNASANCTLYTNNIISGSMSATTYQGNVVTRFSDSIDSTGNTTAGAFTILKSMTIPANTYTTGDTVVFKFRVRKNATNGTMNYRISTNTTLSLTGSQTLGVFNAGATIVFGELSRVLSIKGATSEVFNTSITNVTDDSTTSTSAISSLSINWSVNQFIMFNINQASALDTTNISYYSITKI